MTTFLESVGGSYHLSNTLLLSELLAKLPIGRRLQWAEKCLPQNDVPTINGFSQWLSDIRKIVNMATDALPVTCEHKRDRNYGFTSVEWTKCKSMMNCKVFLWLPLETRIPCFSWLKYGHRVNTCYIKQRCSIVGCDRYHHILLHLSSLS